MLELFKLKCSFFHWPSEDRRLCFVVVCLCSYFFLHGASVCAFVFIHIVVNVCFVLWGSFTQPHFSLYNALFFYGVLLNFTTNLERPSYVCSSVCQHNGFSLQQVFCFCGGFYGIARSSFVTSLRINTSRVFKMTRTQSFGRNGNNPNIQKNFMGCSGLIGALSALFTAICQPESNNSSVTERVGFQHSVQKWKCSHQRAQYERTPIQLQFSFVYSPCFSLSAN